MFWQLHITTSWNAYFRFPCLEDKSPPLFFLYKNQEKNLKNKQKISEKKENGEKKRGFIL